ncbi:Unknown protein sequence [Pseudomonas amygdali pv. morsprunorum]|nr:Unknown protein sequence [Pseudomonas amygdali pv. morsprunorum]
MCGGQKHILEPAITELIKLDLILKETVFWYFASILRHSFSEK